MRLVLMLALIGTSAAYAQTPDERALAAARSLKCEFPAIAVTNWQGDEPSPVLKKQEFAFHIDGIDLKAEHARLIGNVGAEDLTVVHGSGVIHLLERTTSGNLNVTSVFADRSQHGGFKAVHSRHVVMVGGPLPSQAYGHCQIWR